VSCQVLMRVILPAGLWIDIVFDANPDPTFYFDAPPDPDPSFILKSYYYTRGLYRDLS
jgi:hypothetical protein